ncbi:u2 small nuclear RNA auxiliary factor 1 [Anaeramoeba flamelloides]|uniref:U2 small nuclear RNA auxiliary factor 1 n=1 Tax=Anaeramoeba flamelloides TaxID=1746091 RepID=A0ABQ8XCL5_9EUKA|nr:u2 small nuclear RNA auxiliary factor 1 [Anaeramoeba flamelloides]
MRSNNPNNNETEECRLYQKIGSCRHGERCNRKHHIPNFSKTILLPNLYPNPSLQLKDRVSSSINRELQTHLETFYEDIFLKLMEYGEIDELMVAENLSSHLVGNTYVRFVSDLGAARAFRALNHRFYNGALLKPEFSPVVNFSNTRCRQNDRGREGCFRGHSCNFLHIRDPSQSLLNKLFRIQREYYDKLYEKRKQFEKEKRKSNIKENENNLENLNEKDIPINQNEEEYENENQIDEKKTTQGQLMKIENSQK